MNAVIDHHRTDHQKARAFITAGVPGWSHARAIQTKLLSPKCKPGMVITHEVPRDTPRIEFNGVLGIIKDQLNVLVDAVEALAPSPQNKGIIRVRRAVKARRGKIAARIN